MHIETTAAGIASVRLGTGITVRYLDLGNDAGDPIVFVHGWPDSGFSFSRVMPLLHQERTHAMAYDQRGFGDADRPASGYSIDQFAIDAVSFLDAIRIDRATLVGHSFGTFVARRAAELFPERVGRLVLIGSAVSARNDVLREILDMVKDLEDPIPLEFVREFQASALHIPVPEVFFGHLVAESRKAPARVWLAALANLLDFDDTLELARIATPTLIIWGEHDSLFASRAEQAHLAATIPDARLFVYPDTGHSPNWERPERVARDVQAFLVEPAR